MTQGPNVKKLIVERMSRTMSRGGFTGAIETMLAPDGIGAAAREAAEFARAGIALVKAAPDNPLVNARNRPRRKNAESGKSYKIV